MAKDIREKGLKKVWKEINRVLYRKSLLYLPKIIRTKKISRHHDNPLASHFGVKKVRKLVIRKYYWPTLRANIEAYVKGCDICIA